MSLEMEQVGECKKKKGKVVVYWHSALKRSRKEKEQRRLEKMEGRKWKKREERSTEGEQRAESRAEKSLWLADDPCLVIYGGSATVGHSVYEQGSGERARQFN